MECDFPSLLPSFHVVGIQHAKPITHSTRSFPASFKTDVIIIFFFTFVEQSNFLHVLRSFLNININVKFQRKKIEVVKEISIILRISIIQKKD